MNTRRNYYIFWSCIALTLFVNWGTPESSIESGRKHPVNFYGSFTTNDQRSIDVENIALGGLYKDIPVYDMPAIENKQIYTMKEKDGEALQNNKALRYKLEEDPHKGIITKIDLAEVASIVVPDPKAFWIFKRKNGYRPLEFIEIEIISNDARKTKNNYLIETSRKITCDQINEAGPLEKIIPFDSIQSLTIKGYNYVDRLTSERAKREIQEKKAATGIR